MANISKDPIVSRRNLLVLGGLGATGVGALAWRRYQLGARFFNPLKLDDFSLAPVSGLKYASGQPVPGFSAPDLKRGPAIVALVASWCPDCRTERPELIRAAQAAGVPAYAVMVLDHPRGAAEFFKDFGMPFAGVGDDPGGYFMRMMGARGVPATFVTRPNAAEGQSPKITYRNFGALTAQDFEQNLLPALASS